MFYYMFDLYADGKTVSTEISVMKRIVGNPVGTICRIFLILSANHTKIT